MPEITYSKLRRTLSENVSPRPSLPEIQKVAEALGVDCTPRFQTFAGDSALVEDHDGLYYLVVGTPDSVELAYTFKESMPFYSEQDHMAEGMCLSRSELRQLAAVIDAMLED